jgi:HSF-type DNA-binding
MYECQIEKALTVNTPSLHFPDSIESDDGEFRTLFPYRLHQVLSLVERDGLSHIVSWFPCGTKFKVHKRKEFTNEVMPKIGRFTVYKSFLRQLSMYKFQRISSGGIKGAYQHPYFRRDHIDLCRAILRGEIYIPKSKQLNSNVNPCARPENPQRVQPTISPQGSYVESGSYGLVAKRDYLSTSNFQIPFQLPQSDNCLSGNISDNVADSPPEFLLPSNVLSTNDDENGRLSQPAMMRKIGNVLDEIIMTLGSEDPTECGDITAEIIATFRPSSSFTDRGRYVC